MNKEQIKKDIIQSASGFKDLVANRIEAEAKYASQGLPPVSFMPDEIEIWRINAKKTPLLGFPLNLMVSLSRFLTGKKINGQLIITNKRIIYIFKNISFWVFTRKEAYECLLINRLSSISSGVDYTLFRRKNVITINKQDNYYFDKQEMAIVENIITKLIQEMGSKK
jgi:hypothetical protein